MNTFLQICGLALGFAMLIKGADIFVNASVNIATWLKVPSVVIALTIVAFGTSAPEAMISIVAASGGSTELAMGNAIGSNIFNLILILGLCAVIKPIAISIKDFATDYWVSVGAAGLLLAMTLIFTTAVPRAGGLFMLVVFIVYVTLLVTRALKNRPQAEPETTTPSSLLKSIVLALIGIALIVIGGHFTVVNAEGIALTLGLTPRVVGLTVVAIGTSLPELVISLIACKKGENDMAVGLVVGSNIFNILFVLGISGIIMPLAVDSNLVLDLVVLIVGSLAFLLFATTSKRVARWEGAVLVAMYVAYIGFILVG